MNLVDFTCFYCLLFLSEKKDGAYSIPHPLLIDIVASWLMEQPNFCLMKIPRIFLNLPSIHGFTGKHMNMHFKFCPLLSLLEWCILEPVYAGNNLTVDEKQKSRPAYSKLHYAFISFIASQKKFESRKYDSDSDSDDQEEGELLEDNEGIELFLKMDVIYLVQSLQEYLVAHKDKGGGMLLEVQFVYLNSMVHELNNKDY